MKKIGTIVLLATFILQAFSQEVTAVNKDTLQKVTVADTNETARVIVGDKAIVVENEKDAFKVRIGDRGLTILESLEGKAPKIEFNKFDSQEDRQDQEENNNIDRDQYKYRRHFKGHWSGAEIGYNNFLTADRSMTLPSSIDYMSLHSGKSINFNINFSQLSLGITRHIGFVTGLGLDWNNYRFDGNNNIQKGLNGIIEMLDPGAPLKKSKLTTFYIDLPFLFEIQIPAENNHINIAAGPIGGVKLGSHTKMVFEDGDKVHSEGDFSLNLLRYGGTARVGYGNFQIYGTYYMTPLFKNGKAPEGVDLYPFELGIAFTFND